MNTTRRVLKQRAKTLKQRFCDVSRFKRPVTFGKGGNIACGVEGSYTIDTITNITIDGCDWLGAAHIFFTLDPYNELISDRDSFYFMAPGNDTLPTLNKHAIFIIIFHHLYTKLGLPFRISIEDKYKMLQSHFEDESYEDELMRVQRELGIAVFPKWSAFKEMFTLQKEEPSIFNDAERVKALSKLIKAPEQMISFLRAPLDDIDTLLSDMRFTQDIERDDLASLLMEKLDSHEIFLSTGVMPIQVDWLRRLDVILKRC